MQESKTRLKAACMYLALIAIVVAVTVFIDRVVGVIFPAHSQEMGLLLTKNSTVRYESAEFECVATTNSLGFRDREFEVPKPQGVFRIVAIGDSYTFGWGVADNESWPKQLERKLRQRLDRPVEVANLGKAGSSPIWYPKACEKIIPVLAPDLVVMCILHGDDLYQLHTPEESPRPKDVVARQRNPARTELARYARAAIRRVYPNMLRLLVSGRSSSEMSTRATWKSQAKRILDKSDDRHRARFEELDTEIQSLFLEGRLNPFLLGWALWDPDRFLCCMDLQRSETRILQGRLRNVISETKDVCDSLGTTLEVVGAPYACYASTAGLEGLRRVGYNTDPAMLVSDAPDDIIKQACEDAGVGFISVLSQFRQVDTESFYFPLDGHFTPAGHAYFAECVASDLLPILENLLKRNQVKH